MRVQGVKVAGSGSERGSSRRHGSQERDGVRGNVVNIEIAIGIAID
jgi:hypothetical protein